MNEQYKKLREKRLAEIGYVIDQYMNDIEKLKGVEKTFDLPKEHLERYINGESLKEIREGEKSQ